MTNKGHGARLGDFVMINHAKHALRVANDLFVHLNNIIIEIVTYSQFIIECLLPNIDRDIREVNM